MFKTKLIFLSIIFLFFGNSIQAQQKYWVFFKDKKNVVFDPYSYFDEKALERRINHGLPLFQYTDLPVNEVYISEVSRKVDSISNVTRWFNGLSVFANENQIQKLSELDFVEEITKIIGYGQMLSVREDDFDFDEEKTELARKQTNNLGLPFFEKNNIDGSGIRIAIFDAGFPSVDKNPAFEHLRKNSKIIKTYDFCRKKENVYDHASHGTMVLSCIAGIVDNKKIGLATGAEFLLARTEFGVREPFVEEEYWLAAAEWADKNGAQIINSSLGYTYHRYFPEEMDGKTSLVSRAANMAASKGILVVNSAGNEGSDDWKILSTPADADSVLSIGGISPGTELHINFSSFGPNARKKMKPNVCAYGEAVVSGPRKLTVANGTSFSSPLIAGFAACAWQTNRSLTNMQLFTEIEKSADLYPYFDYAHGYGVPQADYFFSGKQTIMPTFEVIRIDDVIQIKLKQGWDESKVKRDKYLYYHIENDNRVLEKYVVLLAESTDVLSVNADEFGKGKLLRIHFRGYTETIVL